MPIDPRYAVRALIGLTVFGVLSAGVGTVLAIGQQGAGVPASYLAGTPFRSFLVPGLILGGIVGGTQLAAAITLVQRRRSALLWSAIAAFGMLLWIFVELAMIQHYSWLQTIYFMFGIIELVLVLALLGLVPAVMARWRPEQD
jgi:hypothetical protein